MRLTHSYTILNVSQQTYNEIRSKLQTAAYDHAFHEDGKIDMQGIALQTDSFVIGKVSSPKYSTNVNIITPLCVWCGKPYDEHADCLDPSGFVPRMPCVGLKSGFHAG